MRENIKKVGFLVLLLILFSMVAQAGEETIITNTGFPVPPYVKRGLVVYYDAGGYVVQQGKADYVTFQKIILVQAVEGDSVIGTVYTINPNTHIFSVDTKLLGKGGSGIFYIHPEYAKKMVGKKEMGCDFKSPGIIEYNREKISGTIEYDVKSGLFLGAKVKGDNTESVETYKGYEYVNLPELPSSFPGVVKGNYSYSVYTIFQNLNTPFGTITISPVSFGKKTAIFNMTTSVYGGMSSTKKVYGTTLIGPHYIHPSMVKEDGIFFSLKNYDMKYYIQGADQYGKLAYFVADGTKLSETHVDPNTGLILLNDQFVSGMIGVNGIIRSVLNQ